MDAWLEELEVIQEKIEAKIEANNEKFEVLQGTVVSRMDIHQPRTEFMQGKKNGRQPKVDESRPRRGDGRKEGLEKRD
jgi:hypothetical protein